jgi:hypothetical protein
MQTYINRVRIFSTRKTFNLVEASGFARLMAGIHTLLYCTLTLLATVCRLRYTSFTMKVGRENANQPTTLHLSLRRLSPTRPDPTRPEQLVLQVCNVILYGGIDECPKVRRARSEVSRGDCLAFAYKCTNDPVFTVFYDFLQLLTDTIQ